MNQLIRFVVAPCILIGTLISPQTLAAAQAQGWGRVNMQGAIIDTACAIAAGSRDQAIDMGSVPVADIIRDGQGISRPFSIELINCVLTRSNSSLPDWQHFQVTFDGEADGESFGVRGEAKGVALQITDVGGNIANPGQALPAGDITPGDKTLNYTLRLVTNKQLLKAGDYYSTLRFKMDYY